MAWNTMDSYNLFSKICFFEGVKIDAMILGAQEGGCEVTILRCEVNARSKEAGKMCEVTKKYVRSIFYHALTARSYRIYRPDFYCRMTFLSFYLKL